MRATAVPSFVSARARPLPRGREGPSPRCDARSVQRATAPCNVRRAARDVQTRLPFGSRYDNHVEAFLVFLQLVVGDAAADIENDSVW